jgi:NADH-quinone oxidoreductase subunit N
MGEFAKMFTSLDYVVAWPMIELTIFALGILLFDVVFPEEKKGRWLHPALALMGLAFAAEGVWNLQRALLHSEYGVQGFPSFVGTVWVDGISIYFFYLFLAGAALSVLISVRYLETENEHRGEYYALMLFSVVGMMCMACALDIVLLFIGLELMAISTYILVGFLRRDRRSNEAALKYLLLGAFSSGIFAYGLSLFYGLSGSTNLFMIARQLHSGDRFSAIAVLAMLATATGLFFKIAAVPFHQWAPDAYEGAPTSITAFMSVAVKAAAWAMMIRVLVYGLGPMRSIYLPLLIVVAVATMAAGNIAAITQSNLKRLLAYSSIAHVGYMLLGLVAFASATDAIAAREGLRGILIYLLVYTFMNVGAFAVITSLRRRDIIGDEIDDINGLYSRAPVEAVLMLVFLLSLAGIPPLAGFWGKYFIFLSLIQSQHYVLATIAVLFAVIGLYYYLRIANAMLVRPAADDTPVLPSLGMKVALGLAALGTVVIGLFPNPFIQFANTSLSLQSSGAMNGLLR